MRHGNDVAGGCDAVLKGHAVSSIALTAAVIPGWCFSTRPGISRFSDAQLRIVVRCFASPRNDGKARPSRTDRRLERERGIPGKVNPGILRHFGDEGIDQ